MDAKKIQDSIKFENVGISCNKKAVVSDLSFSLDAGEILLLLGKEGSGKTTLFRVLKGYCPYNEGLIIPPKRLKISEVGFMPSLKKPVRNTYMSAWEVVICSAKATRHVSKSQGAREKTNARKLLSRLGIERYKSSHYRDLPGDIQQKMLFARALNIAKRLLMLEDPFSLIENDEDIALMKEMIKECAEKGAIVMISSRSYEKYIDLADKVICLDDNFYGTRDEFLKVNKGQEV